MHFIDAIERLAEIAPADMLFTDGHDLKTMPEWLAIVSRKAEGTKAATANLAEASLTIEGRFRDRPLMWPAHIFRFHKIADDLAMEKDTPWHRHVEAVTGKPWREILKEDF